MTNKGKDFGHGTTMPTSHEADLYLNEIAEVESPGSDFYAPSSGGGPKIGQDKGNSRQAPLPEGGNPFFGGGGGKSSE